MMKFHWISFLLFITFVTNGQTDFPGHSHNDYQQGVPLESALAQGYRSIEIDVHLTKNKKVRVAHTAFFIKRKPEIGELYIQPILNKLKKNNGLIYHDSSQLILMIDLKGDEKSELISQLHFELRPIMKYIQRVGSQQWAPIKVLLSGHPPRTSLPFFKEDIFFIDGNINDLEAKNEEERIARVSFDFSSVFDWKGKDKISGIEKVKLQEMVKLAHEKGYLIRFWNSPDTEVVWEVLLENGVDWINVDDLVKFKEFYSNYKKQ